MSHTMDPPWTEHSFIEVIDVMFTIAAAHWLWCIRPMPKTYLSEIIFPLQFCLRGMASLWLVLVAAITLVYTSASNEIPTGFSRHSAALLIADSIAWTLSTALIWMEHRRGLRTSPLLRAFWILRWSLLTKYLWGVVTQEGPATSWPVPVAVLNACLFASHSILASAGVWPTRQLTTSSPEVVAIARERIKSFSGKSFVNRPLHHSSGLLHLHVAAAPSSYGSFGQVKSSRGAASTRDEAAPPMLTPFRPTLKICIPSWTLSKRSDTSYVSYKVLILSDDEAWSVRRRYSDFVHLRNGLPQWMHAGVHFPDKSVFKRFDPKLIDTRRAQLEMFLNHLVGHADFDAHRSLVLCDFLDLEYIAHPDDFLV